MLTKKTCTFPGLGLALALLFPPLPFFILTTYARIQVHREPQAIGWRSNRAYYRACHHSARTPTNTPLPSTPPPPPTSPSVPIHSMGVSRGKIQRANSTWQEYQIRSMHNFILPNCFGHPKSREALHSALLAHQ